MSSQNCSRCGTALLANAKLCGRCGFPAVFVVAGSVSGSEWAAGEHEFAIRIRPQQIKAWFSKGINVDESQTGLLFESGRFEHELTPGRQKLESLPDRVRKYVSGETASAVLIRRGLFPLSVLGTALTPEGNEISFECEVGIQVGDRNAFYVNLMQSSDVVTSGDLMQRFGTAARKAVHSVIASCRSNELLTVHPELQQRLIDTVDETLSPIAARWGLKIGYVSPPSFSNKQLFEFQKERAELVRNLRGERLKQEYAEAKDRIEIRRFQASRALAEAEIRNAIEKAERTLEFDKVKADLRQNQTLHGLQLDESMDAAIDSFAARKRERSERNEDAASLRTHLLASADVKRQQELAELKYEFRKRSIGQQQELDDLTRVHDIKVAEEELAAEIRRLDSTQAGEIVRWQRQRTVNRQDQVAESEVKAQTSQIIADADRERAIRDFNEAQRQREKLGEHKVSDLEKMSQVQAAHQARLLEIDRKQKENQALAEKSKHELAEDTKEREHQRKIAELQLLKDSPEMMQMLKMAELAVQNPSMSAAFGDVMKMAMAKGMTGEQLEQVMASQSPEVAKALQEKYRAQALVAQSTAQAQQASLERIITELKSARDLSSQQMTDFMDRMERLGINGQQMLKDVGVASGGRSERSDNPVDSHLLAKLVERVEELRWKIDRDHRS